MTRAEAVEWLQSLAAEKGRVPTMTDMIPRHMTMVRLFGGIAKAQAAAGFTPRRPGRPTLTETP